MGELYSWMDRIYVVNKGFKIIFLKMSSIYLHQTNGFRGAFSMASCSKFPSEGFPGLLSTTAWLRGPFVRDGITGTGLPNV